MEAHFRQCDGKKGPVIYYNDLVSQNNKKVSIYLTFSLF